MSMDEPYTVNDYEAEKKMIKEINEKNWTSEYDPTEDAFYLMKKEDKVDHPAHYNQGKIECIDAIEASTAGLKGAEAFCTGNAIKYIWRWKDKNGAEDIDKAIWYLNRLKHMITSADRIH